MKKLILILLLVTSTMLFSQEIDNNYKSVVTLPTYTMDGDTAYTFNMIKMPYSGFQFVWDSLDKTDASVKVQISYYLTGENFVDDTSLDSLLFNSAAGNSIIESTIASLAKRKRLLVDSGTCGSGTLIINGNLGSIKQWKN